MKWIEWKMQTKLVHWWYKRKKMMRWHFLKMFDVVMHEYIAFHSKSVAVNVFHCKIKFFFDIAVFLCIYRCIWWCTIFYVVEKCLSLKILFKWTLQHCSKLNNCAQDWKSWFCLNSRKAVCSWKYYVDQLCTTLLNIAK